MRLHVLGCILPEDHVGKCGVPEETEEGSFVAAKQVGGTHYQETDIQPWEVIARAKLDFWEGNAVKYVMRYKYKDGLKDLLKAQHYIEYLIQREMDASDN